ncbi:MAG TPA: hemerythrin domain-containing protein [Gammaproteobacteria bacterium]|nr:hemerythrin domain-containing protein [Gammaproteobacteria bacterium]
MATAKATIDHDTIKRWVEEHGGCPAHVKRSGSKKDPGILRIDFPGYSGRESLERISWDEFFDAFDGNELALLYQDDENSRFSKFVSRDTVDVADGGSSRSRGRSARSAAASKASSRSKSSSSRSRSSSAKSASGSSRSSSARGRSSARSRADGNGSSAKSARGRSGANGRSGARSASRAKAPAEEGIDAIALLSEQHREVEGLFEKLESARGSSQKERIFAKLADALAAHSRIEEEIFYPSVFTDETETELRESVEEHLVVKRLVADMLDMEASDPQFMSKASVLKEVVRHHVEEEEHQLFPEVREQNADELEELGAKMQQRFEQLMQREPRKQVPKEARAASVPF